MDVKNLVQKIGYDELAHKLGVGKTAVSNAVQRGRLPTAWYPIVRDLCEQNGVSINEDLFNFKTLDFTAQMDGRLRTRKTEQE